MLTAQESFDGTVKTLELLETIDAMLEIELRIKAALGNGYFVVYGPQVKPKVGEKVAMELEEFGYCCSVHPANMKDADGDMLCYVSVSWRYAPNPQSRVNSSIACN